MNQYGLKHRSVADAAGYDVSYVSKWLNSDVMPASAAIDGVCSAIADLAAGMALCESDEERDSLRERLCEELRSAYEADDKTSGRRRDDKGKGAAPAFDRKAAVFAKLRQLRATEDECRLSVFADLAQLPASELVFLIDVLNYVRELDFARGGVWILLPEGGLRNMDKSVNVILLLNLLMVRSNVRLFCHRTLVSRVGLVLLGDRFVYSGQCWSRGQWLFESMSDNEAVAAKLVATLNRDIMPTAQRQFLESRFTSKPMDWRAESSFRRAHGRMVLGELSTMFCSEGLLSDIAHKLPGGGYLDRCEAQRKNLLKRLEEGGEVQCLVYQQALYRLVFEGLLFAGGVTVELSIVERHRYLQDLAMLMDAYECLSVRSTSERYIVSDIKHRFLPQLLLGEHTSCFVSFPVDGAASCCFACDRGLRAVLEHGFDCLWEGEGPYLNDLSEVIGDYLGDLEVMLPT